jgi:deoxycytidine triphosphate deaminase
MRLGSLSTPLKRNRMVRWLLDGRDRWRRSRAAAWLNVRSIGYRPPNIDYWRAPPDRGLTPLYWNDPWPNLQGMLNSETITRYHEAIGGMIRPFDLNLLKPASYELTLGPRCLVEGKEKVLTDRMPYLVIPQNSIVFVSMRQVLCLPHYIVGRFDLAIDFIYQGLLLGTGPQVDPGFQGALGCPLHNISNDDIQMRLDEPFAKIDFVKTVPRSADVSAQWDSIGSEQQLERWLRDNRSSNVRLFKDGKPAWREPIFGYTQGRRPTSSVQKITRSLRRYRVYGLFGALAVVAGVAALVFAALQLSDGLSSTKQELRHLRACAQSLEYRLEPQGKSSHIARPPAAVSTPCLER